MPRYTNESRERVRDAVDFVDLVGSRTDLRRAGPRRYTGLCPFHDERTPSFGIDPIEKLYHCFGCAAGGDVFQFVMDTENLDFGQALELLADRYGVQLELESEDPLAQAERKRQQRLLALLDRTASFYQRVLAEAEVAEPARQYLEKRGINSESLSTFRVGFAPEEWRRVLQASQKNGYSLEEIRAAGLVVQGRGGDFYDRFRGRIVFPLFDARGRIRGFGARTMRDGEGPKYVNSPDSSIFQKGKGLYGFHLARTAAAQSGEVLLVEGYTDVISLHQAGVHNVVGQMGTALTEQQAAELSRLAKRILFRLDPDAAGQQSVQRGAELLRRRHREMLVVALPLGDDPADVVEKNGVEAFNGHVEQAMPLTGFMVERELDHCDLTKPQERDRALAEIARLISVLGPSAQRDDLIRRVSERLQISGEAVNAALSAWQQLPDPNSDGRKRDNGNIDPLARRELTEQAFLSMCLALPSEGERQLAALDLESAFTSPMTMRAATYLVSRLSSPGSDLPPGDDDFARLIAELVVRAGELHVTETTLEIEALQLELARLDREVSAARGKGEGVQKLAARRQKVLETIRHKLH